MKNLIICENLKYPPDEGASKLTIKFITSLSKEVTVINFGENLKINETKVIRISYCNIPILGFIWGRLISIFYVIKLMPEHIYYFPLCAPKVINQFYASILNIFTPDFKEVLFQTDRLAKIFSKFKISVFSKNGTEFLKKQGLQAEYISIPHVTPVKKYNKEDIRKKYGMGQDDFIALHIGHAEDGRGLDVLSELQNAMPETKIVLVLTSRKKIEKKLLNPKIKIIDRYLEDIYEAYAMSDVYLFPIKSKNSAIDVPLSIIEAKEMGLPIIASDVGFVKESLEEYPKGFLIKVKDAKQMAQDIQTILKQKII